MLQIKIFLDVTLLKTSKLNSPISIHTNTIIKIYIKYSCLSHETRPYSITARCNRIKPPLISKQARCTKGRGWHEIFTVNFQWGPPAIEDKAGPTLAILFPPPPLPLLPSKSLQPRLVPSRCSIAVSTTPLTSFLSPPTCTRIAFSTFSRISEWFLRGSVIASHHRFVPVAFHGQTSLGKALEEIRARVFRGCLCARCV